MHVEIVPCLRDNYAYLVVGLGGRAVVVDPSEAGPVQQRLQEQGLELVGIWCTHHHQDHVGGVLDLLAAHPGLPVVGSSYDAQHGRIPGLTRSLAEQDTLWFESHRVRLLAVPGHTLGAIAYGIEGALFSGDTLFTAGCGRMFEGTPPQMLQSLDQLAALPGDTKLYCGHEYTLKNLEFAATIEPDNTAISERLLAAHELRARGTPTVPASLDEELQTNPFLRVREPQVITKARSLGAASDQPADIFAALRRAKDAF